MFLDATDSALLPAQALWNDGALTWRLPRRALSGTQIRVRRSDRSGALDNITLSRSLDVDRSVSAVEPNATRTLALGGFVPVAVTATAATRAGAVAVHWNGTDAQPAAALRDRAWQWIEVPETANPVTHAAALAVDIAGQSAFSASVSLAASSISSGTIAVARPQTTSSSRKARSCRSSMSRRRRRAPAPSAMPRSRCATSTAS